MIVKLVPTGANLVSEDLINIHYLISMIINYNVPVKQEMCPARRARQEYCFSKNNKSIFFLP